MENIKSFAISAGYTIVFNIDVIASDAKTALAIAKTDWRKTNSANWRVCDPADPLFQIEHEHDVPPSDAKIYNVTYDVTDCLHAQVTATNKEEALRIARSLRDQSGTYEGNFEIVSSQLSEMNAEEAVS